MDNFDIIRRLRGAFKNALAWGGAWFVGTFVMITVLRLVGVLSENFNWLGALGIAMKAGVIGAVAGGAFSTLIALLYRGRRLSEISWVRFGVLGGIATGIFVPVFFQMMNVLSGDGFVAMSLVLDDAVWAAVFGGVTAGGSLKLAQYAEKAALPGGDRDRLTSSENIDRLGSGERDT